MISPRSLFYFVTTNLFLLGIGCIQHLFWRSSCMGGIGILLRNLLLTWALDRSTQHYPWIGSGGNRETSIQMDTYLYDVTKTTLVEIVGVFCVLKWVVREAEAIEYGYGYGSLLRIAFLFEILFDLFHYLTHRALHHRTVYAWFHKEHHQHHTPTVYSTYHHHPVDLLLTNIFPMMMSLYCVQWLEGEGAITPLVFHCLHTYKEYIEISGHSGREIRKTGSFVQCIWIPRFLGISLYTRDHDLHHQRGDCNYGKRFSLWDKVFGTTGEERIEVEIRDRDQDQDQDRCQDGDS